MQRASLFSLWAVALPVKGVACQQIPLCATGLEGSSCSRMDIQCICADTALQQNISGCIVMAYLNISNTMCGIKPRDISHNTTTVTSVFMSLAITFTLRRGDIFAILSLDGYGKDIWTLPFGSITCIVNTGIWRVSWVLIAINALYLLVYGFGTEFNCVPVLYIRTKWHGKQNDLILFPLHKIAGLSVSMSKNIMLLSILTVVSILRLRVVITYVTTTNVTYNTLATSYWSLIERFSGINVTPGCSSTPETMKLPMELSILKRTETAVRRKEMGTDTESLFPVSRNR
ncbi:hypothetical protein BDV40DRAFT_293793 [Aspergillus tamarii]|uniref:Rhodopsin domain-containing protein n=1 Tax=Aspergillus tamarii TaxID=41984 RepID=A0A5N6UC10_ASPTM|nr:hypothetical protein BDV40DRAFT_293793 [Aspergillus tamarii]